MEEFDVALEALRGFVAQAGNFLPRLLLALLIVLAGWLLAKIARFALKKALRSINFHVLTERAGIDTFLQMGGGRTDMTAVLGLLVYLLILVWALLFACNSLGLAYVSELLARLALFVPRMMLSLIIIAFGAYFAQFVGSRVTRYWHQAGLDEASALGRIARYAVLLFVLLISLDQLDLGGDLIRQSFLILLSGIVLALALAFGFGARQLAERLLQHWMPRDEMAGKDHPAERPHAPQSPPS